MCVGVHIPDIGKESTTVVSITCTLEKPLRRHPLETWPPPQLPYTYNRGKCENLRLGPGQLRFTSRLGGGRGRLSGHGHTFNGAIATPVKIIFRNRHDFNGQRSRNLMTRERGGTFF